MHVIDVMRALRNYPRIKQCKDRSPSFWFLFCDDMVTLQSINTRISI